MQEPTIRLVLTGLEKEIHALRGRLGLLEIEGWQDMTEAERDEVIHQTWPEFERVLRGIKFLHWRVGRLGRHRGERVKVTSAMVRTIKKNGRHNITALAKKLGVSRPTIYGVLKEAEAANKPEPRPKRPKMETMDLVSHPEILHTGKEASR